MLAVMTFLLTAKHYIRTWFFLDLLSSIPLDYIYLIFSGGDDVSKIVKNVKTVEGDNTVENR